MEITQKQFMTKQPRPHKVTAADQYYHTLAQRLARLWDNAHVLPAPSDAVKRAVVIGVVGYYQDVVADAGLWRTFTGLHRQLYGKPLPFYAPAPDYVDFELNLDDLRFVIWYILEGYTSHKMALSPLDAAVERLAAIFYRVLDAEYEQAPNPVSLTLAVGVDPTDVDDASSIYDLSRWLFFGSYLLPPAANKVIAAQLMQSMKLVQENPRDLDDQIRDLEDRTMLGNPCGPLALEIGVWVEAIATGRLPQLADAADPDAAPHKLWTALTTATGGSEITFFPSYGQMERFLVKYLRWKADSDGIFPHLRHTRNLVLLANRKRGMLVAANVAQFIAHPANPCYNAAAAREQAHTLVTEQGRCPVDLTKYLFANNLLPDAAIPADTTGRLLHDNWDFLARLYQQAAYND